MAQSNGSSVGNNRSPSALSEETRGAYRQSFFFGGLPQPASRADGLSPLLPRRSGTDSSGRLGVPSSIARPLSSASRRARGLVSGLRTAIARHREERAESAQAPQCARHGTRTCAEHMNWVIGTDVDKLFDEDARLEVDVLTHDDARFDPHSDSMFHDMPERSFAYESPKNHWFHFCTSCKLSFLKGPAGHAVRTHPSHLATHTGFGARAVAVFVDAQYTDGLAQWTVNYGPRSPYNLVARTPGVSAGQVELHAVADCLSLALTLVADARRVAVHEELVTNSVAFAAAAQRFTLLIFSPLKAVLMLCKNDKNEVLMYNVSGSPPGFIYPSDTAEWVRSRMDNDEFKKELKNVEELLQKLSKQGIYVKFAHMPENGPYKPNGGL